jgi:1-deoxy-D-xylulose-5-phosphate synthase
MQRAFDMIVHDIALQNLNVALCMDRAGLSGDDGPTHHGLFDIAYLRSIPGVIAMQPRDEEEFADMLWTMANHHEGPIAIRYPRGAGTGALPRTAPRLLEIGKAEVLRHGADVALFGLGNFCEVAAETGEILARHGINAAVINPRWIKPLDTGTLEFFARSVQVLCTLEDHAVTGGFGAAVAEHLSEAGIATPLIRVGWPDQFIEHGSVAILREKYGMTAKAAADRILEAFRNSAAKKGASL